LRNEDKYKYLPSNNINYLENFISHSILKVTRLLHKSSYKSLSNLEALDGFFILYIDDIPEDSIFVYQDLEDSGIGMEFNNLYSLDIGIKFKLLNGINFYIINYSDDIFATENLDIIPDNWNLFFLNLKK